MQVQTDALNTSFEAPLKEFVRMVKSAKGVMADRSAALQTLHQVLILMVLLLTQPISLLFPCVHILRLPDSLLYDLAEMFLDCHDIRSSHIVMSCTRFCIKSVSLQPCDIGLYLGMQS